MFTSLARPTNIRSSVLAVTLLIAAISASSCRGTSATPPTVAVSPTSSVSAFIMDGDSMAIAQAAIINIAIAKSVHMQGFVTTTSGKKEDMDLSLSGRDGRVVMTDAEGPLKILRIGDFLYIKGTHDYWQPSGPAAVKLMDGKYLKTPTTEKHFAPFNTYFDASQYLPRQNLQKGQLTDVNGTLALALIDPDREQGGTLYVAAQGLPVPLRVQSASGKLLLDYSGYGQPVTISEPSSDQIVTIDQLLSVV